MNGPKVCFFGGRLFRDYLSVLDVMKQMHTKYPNMMVISGDAKDGPDNMAIFAAKQLKIPYQKMPADWNKHGKAAGMIRNVDMAEYSDIGLGWWDGKSKGTKHMAEVALPNAGKPVKVKRYEMGTKLPYTIY